jgi:hypothetical protein
MSPDTHAGFLDDEEWSIICLWIRNSAKHLKRVVIQNQSISQEAKRFIKSSLKNTASPLVEINIMNNEFVNNNKESIASTKQFIAELMAKRNDFNVWESRRVYKIKQDAILLNESVLLRELNVNSIFPTGSKIQEKEQSALYFIDQTFACNLADITKVSIHGCERYFFHLTHLAENHKFPPHIKHFEICQVLNLSEVQATDFVQLIQSLSANFRELRTVKLNVFGGESMERNKDKEKLQIKLIRAVRNMKELFELSLPVFCFT